MTGAGVVDADPGGGGEPCPQHGAILGEKALLLVGQEPLHLPLGDVDADVLQQPGRPLHRALALMVLREHEATQLGAEVARAKPRRQRRHHRRAFRRQPALAAVADHPRPDHEILHHEVLVALEARSGRHRRLQDHLLHRRPRGLRPAPTGLAPLRRRRLLHPRRLGRLERRRTLQPLQPAVLLRSAATSARNAAFSSRTCNSRPLSPSASSASISLGDPAMTTWIQKTRRLGIP